MVEKIKRTKLSETYTIERGDYKMRVELKRDGYGKVKKRLTITNKAGKNDFVFVGSRPDTVRSIGELLIAASKL